MGGQQPGMPHSPRDAEDYSMDVDGPGDNPGYVSLFIEVCNQTATSIYVLVMLTDQKQSVIDSFFVGLLV